MCMTTIDSPYSHKEPVLDLKWVYDSNLKRHLLASAGADGKVNTDLVHFFDRSSRVCSAAFLGR